MIEGPEGALAEIVAHLQRLDRPFALVGGLAVSIRGEVRFTRDVDIALAVEDDEEMESLVHELLGCGYTLAATAEHEVRHRLATARLVSPSGIAVDLLAASCGIEPEIVAAATPVTIGELGSIPVARAEELLAMKVLSMTPTRRKDEMDALGLVQTNPDIDLGAVRASLRRIAERGYDRSQELSGKLDELLAKIENL